MTVNLIKGELFLNKASVFKAPVTYAKPVEPRRNSDNNDAPISTYSGFIKSFKKPE